MTDSEKVRLALLRAQGFAIVSLYKGLMYFLSFLGPVLVLNQVRWLPVPVLLALAIAGYGTTGVIFHVLLVLTKRFAIGPVTATGVHTVQTKEGQRWAAAAMVSGMQQTGPFSSMTSGLSLLTAWYLRGMGARVPNSVLVGGGVLIRDPWFLEVGENVNIGGGALILGHLGHGKEILLGRVVIGDGAVVGGRSIIFPDVRIGNNARIAAGAVVTRGTVVGEGEVWGGVPAKKISPRSVPS